MHRQFFYISSFLVFIYLSGCGYITGLESLNYNKTYFNFKDSAHPRFACWKSLGFEWFAANGQGNYQLTLIKAETEQSFLIASSINSGKYFIVIFSSTGQKIADLVIESSGNVTIASNKNQSLVASDQLFEYFLLASVGQENLSRVVSSCNFTLEKVLGSTDQATLYKADKKLRLHGLTDLLGYEPASELLASKLENTLFDFESGTLVVVSRR